MTTEELIEVLKQHPGKQVLVFDRQEQLQYAKPEAVTVRVHTYLPPEVCRYGEDFTFDSHLPAEEVIVL